MDIMYKIITLLLLTFWACTVNAEGVKKYYITCDQSDLQEIYDNPLEDTYIPITLEYDGKTWTDAEMRIRGDGSRLDPKKSLKVKFNSEAFANGRDKLNFNAEYLDFTYMSSYLSAHVHRSVGVPVFDIEHAALYINNKFFGLYLNIENVDEQYLEARDMDVDGNLYKATKDGASLAWDDEIKVHWEKKTNENGNFDDLIALRDSVNAVPSSDFKDFLLRNFDYQNLINVIATNILISNASTYYHNYFLYHDINGTGKWMYMPWDMDKTFSHQGYSKDYSYTSHPTRTDNPLIEKCFINDEIFAEVKSKVKEIANNVMNYDKLFPVLDSLKSVIKDYVLMDDTDQIDGLEHWEKSLGNFEIYFKDRINILNRMFDQEPTPFEIYDFPQYFYDAYTVKWEPSTSTKGDVHYKIYLNTNTNIVDGNAKIIDNITETQYTFKDLENGKKYYFMVVAVAEDKERIGFDDHNVFTFYTTKKLPCEITKNTTLTKAGGPYSVECDEVVVAQNVSLTIEAGTMITFDSNCRLKIRGDLQVNGTETDPVIFTPKRDYERFQDIYFHYTTKKCNLNHFIVNNGGMYAQFSEVDVMNMYMTYDYIDPAGDIPLIMFDHSGNKFVGSTIISNGQREGFIFREVDNVEVHNNTMHNTPDAVEFIYCNNSVIYNNKIYDATNDAIDLNGCVNVKIWNNYFYNAADKGISVGNEEDTQSKDIIINNNVFVKCLYGVQVKASEMTVFNNTFVENTTAIHAYERRLGDGGGKVTSYNNILYSNGEDFVIDSKSEGTIEYSLSNITLHEGIGNIKADPLFTDMQNGNYSLLISSPAIDAGDPSSDNDPDGTRADMGAFSYDQLAASVVINEIHYNQDDIVVSGDWVELYNNSDNDINISNWYFSDSDDSHKFIIPEGTILGAHKYVVLVESEFDFTPAYPDVKNFLGNMDFGLSGGGELIRLYNSNSLLIDMVEYDDKEPWPTEPDGDGYTLSLIDPGYDNSLPESWSASEEKYGTPGKSNFGDAVTEIQNDNTFKVYPIPAIDFINIEYTAEQQLNSIYIYDSYGNSIIPDKSSDIQGKFSLDIRNLSSGSYYLIIRLNDGSSLSSKFIIAK